MTHIQSHPERNVWRARICQLCGAEAVRSIEGHPLCAHHLTLVDRIAKDAERKIAEVLA
jgi:hypothetical protein